MTGLGFTVVPALAPHARAAPPALVIDGKGWGHGVGMSQDGAYAMGRAGSTTEEILGHFYPGTDLGRLSGRLRVVVLPGAGPATVIELPGGGEVHGTAAGPEPPGFPVVVPPGGSVELSFDGSRYRARPPGLAVAEPIVAPPPSLAPGAAPSPPTTIEASSEQGLWAVPVEGSTTHVPATDRSYRGVMSAGSDQGGLRLENDVDVEEYLRGMGEVRDPGWPAVSLRAQAVAARTYALRAMAADGEICDTDRCQVYLGQKAEYQAMDQAVADSEGQVVTYGDALALTVYSASGGGFSATPQEGFGPGSGAYPYLVAAPYPTEDPQAWTVPADLADLGRRFGYRGDVNAATVSRAGPSGRALEVTLAGSDGTLAIDGQRFASTLKLRSNLFTLRTEDPVSPGEAASAAGAGPGETAPAPRAPPGLEATTGAGGGSSFGDAGWIALVLLPLIAWVGIIRRADDRGPMP